MRDFLLDVILPRTDAGVLAQVIVAVIAFPALFWLFRHRRDARFVVGAVALFTVAAFGLRAAH